MPALTNVLGGRQHHPGSLVLFNTLSELIKHYQTGPEIEFDERRLREIIYQKINK